MLPESFIVIAALVGSVGYLYYILEMFRGNARPNKVSWGLWTLTSGISFVASLYSGGGLQTVIIFLASFMPFLVFSLSYFIRQSYWETSKLDYYVASIAVLAIFLWIITDNPVVALVFAIVADGLAYIPTIIKSWTTPYSESLLTDILTTVSPVLVILTITSWTYGNYMFPIFLAVMNGSLTIILIMRRYFIVASHPKAMTND